MKQALNNLFKQPGVVTSFVKVVKRQTPTSYQVEDMAGRVSTVLVEQGRFYPSGVSVMVQNGRIIGSGRRAGRHKVYAVRD